MALRSCGKIKKHIFVDKIVRVGTRRVRLNEEAEEYVWLPARTALGELGIEPNARHTLELYAAPSSRTSYHGTGQA